MNDLSGALAHSSGLRESALMSLRRAPTLAVTTLLLACGDPGDGRTTSASGGSGIGGVSITGQGSGASATDGASTGGTATEGSGTDGASGSSGGSSGASVSGGGASESSDSSDPSAGGGPKFDLGISPDGGDAGCQGFGDIDESYIWIPGTGDGTVAKIDTRTLVEVARYRIGPSGGTESASRTAVSGDGRFVVVNSRGTGRSTSIATNQVDCIDQNGDGVITTSQNAADILPWGGDECVRWSVVHAGWGGAQQHGPRGITWTLGAWDEGSCSFVNPKVWLGYMAGGGAAHLVRLDGLTGALEETVIAPAWNGTGYAPYGGALDPDQRPWFTGLRGELVRVNADQNPATLTRIQQPNNIQTYGMTVDPDGNPWMAGCNGPVSMYDVATNQWTSVAGTGACHRGMAIDHDFHVWVASNGPCGLVEIDGKSRTLVAQHQLAQCSTPIGVSVDVDGYVWLVDQQGWAWKIDPANVPAMQQIPVSSSHYVYSDMTGGQLKSIIKPPG